MELIFIGALDKVQIQLLLLYTLVIKNLKLTTEQQMFKIIK